MNRQSSSLGALLERCIYRMRRSFAFGRAPAALLAALLLSLAAPTSLPAQTPGGDDAEAGAPVLVINMERVLRESDAARSIQRQAERIRGTIQKELGDRQEALRNEERELVELRPTLAAAEFAERVESFERRVRALKRDSNERSSLLQKALFEATETLKKRLRPELVAIMEERQADVMLDERNVVISARVLDVTSLAIQRINASTPRIDVAWNAPPWPKSDPEAHSEHGDGSTDGPPPGDTGSSDGSTEGNSD